MAIRRAAVLLLSIAGLSSCAKKEPAVALPDTSSSAIAGSERGAKGCESTVLVDDVFRAAMGDGVSRSAVFMDGKFFGWRLSASPGSKGEHAIPDKSLVTRICGVPAIEINRAEQVCCSASTDENVVVTVDVQGESRDVRVPRDR